MLNLADQEKFELNLDEKINTNKQQSLHSKKELDLEEYELELKRRNSEHLNDYKRKLENDFKNQPQVNISFRTFTR